MSLLTVVKAIIKILGEGTPIILIASEPERSITIIKDSNELNLVETADIIEEPLRIIRDTPYIMEDYRDYDIIYDEDWYNLFMHNKDHIYYYIVTELKSYELVLILKGRARYPVGFV